MSVRRLADEAVQPASFAFSPEMGEQAKGWIAKYPEGRQHSAVIPLLMLAQEQEGWVTRAAIEHVADMLDMPLIRVLEVATFYTQFQLQPIGTKAHIQVCGTTPCMLRGAGELIDLCKKKIHPEPFHTNAAGTLSWEEVECQGACVNAPMVMIFKDTYEDLTVERLDEIIEAFEADKGDTITPGPQIDRTYSAPASGLTSLTDEEAVKRKHWQGSANAEEPSAAEADTQVPPSRAAKPETDARETDPAIKSPSPVKSDNSVEKAASADAPKEKPVQADRVAEETEKTVKTRNHSDGHRVEGEEPELESPELQKAKAVRDPEPGPESPAPNKAAKPSLDDERRPEGIRRPAEPDDLKMISGVGPKIEGILNELGIYTFAQIAAWTQDQRDWVDGYLRFKGRIDRDNWVKQADALARGGEAEYIRVFGKKPR